MYIEPELRDRVYQLFSLEVPKMLQAIESELVTLSVERSATKINNMLRAVHSIKGGAASLGLSAIEELAHQIEDIFRALNHPELPFDRHLDRLLLQIYDGLARLVASEIHREPLEAGFHTQIQIVLADIDEEIGHFTIVAKGMPTDLTYGGIDLTQSLFEVDVAQSLARLERVLLDPECPPPLVMAEFRAQAEVFTGIATLSKLPKLGRLAAATIATLDRQPHRVREICCFALVDFYRALNAVLTGDRRHCGEVSPGFAFLMSEPSLAELELATNRTMSWQSEPSGILNHPNISNDLSDLQELFAPELFLNGENDDLESIFATGDDRENDDLESLIFTSADDRQIEEQPLASQWLLARWASDDRLNISPSSVFNWEPSSIENERAAEPAFDFLIEDLLVPNVVPFDPLGFDLVEIFDRVTTAADVAASVDLVDPLSFDLVEIFDVAVGVASRYENRYSGQLSGLAVVELPVDDLNFDLVHLFEPAAIAAEPSALLAPAFDLPYSIAELKANFDRLPPISPTTFALPPKRRNPLRPKQTRRIVNAPLSQLSVRVGLDRLERMNNLMGELAIERHGLTHVNEQFQETLGRLRAKCANFQTINDRLQQIADNLTISARPSQKIAIEAMPPLEDSNSLFDEHFDLLELDRYSEVHHLAQTTSEQLVQIEEQIEDLSLFVAQSARQIERQQQLLSHLRDDLMWSRMLPLGEILNRFPRTIHDLSIEFNKPVELQITGAGVLVDRAAIDKLLDPLVHLLRNAFDHGIDPPQMRLAAGKPKQGKISISAYHQGSQTIIEVTDDGRGIEIQAIAAKAIAIGLLTPEVAERASRQQLLDLLFEPGFSTAERVTKLSGRGMGLDIVKEQIQSIKGTIDIDSKPGQGTTFRLRIPLTLTIAKLMMCQVGYAVYAFPADSISKITVPTLDRLAYEEDRRVFLWQDRSVPIYNLHELLAYSVAIPERPLSQNLRSSVNSPDDWLSPLLLIRSGERFIALEVDRTISEQELTIVPFGKAIRPPSYTYGCTILGDGTIVPVLDPHTTIATLIDRATCPLLPVISPPEISALDSILVVDDSVTTRQSLCLSLEKYGYRTIQAKDGQEALQLLRQKPNEIKLVICDVEMPNMNGFEFLNIRRQDPNLTHIPVAMLTSRSNAKHRQFAAHLGAIDYFIKPYVEQDFMVAIGKIVNSG